MMFYTHRSECCSWIFGQLYLRISEAWSWFSIFGKAVWWSLSFFSLCFLPEKNTNWQDYYFQMEILPPLFCLEAPHTGGWCSVLGNLYLGFLVLVLPCLADIWTGGGHIGKHLRTPVLFHLPVNVDPWTLLKPNRWPVEICFRCIIYFKEFYCYD